MLFNIINRDYFPGEKKYSEASSGCLFFEDTGKNFKSNLVFVGILVLESTIKDLSLLSGTIFRLLRKQYDKKRRPKSFFLFTDIVRQLENADINTNMIML